MKLNDFSRRGNIPMSIANDNYFCYADPEVAAGDVTWLECAAASVCWNTLLVCYMEEPYGHLMTESTEGPQARTHVRGNLFSFVMPWEDVANCCEQVLASRQRANTRKRGADLDSHPAALPLDENTLATLVNVHIVSGSSDLAKHLEGITMRTRVVLRLIDMLRRSGYPGYETDGLNSVDAVNRRMHERYDSKYQTDAFIPKAVQVAVQQAHRAKLVGPSLVMDKSATPSDPPADVREFLAHTRPAQLIAQRTVQGTTECFDEMKYTFSKYQDLEIQRAAP